MNPFDNLLLDEPPLLLTPDALLQQGRRSVRRRRMLAVSTGTALVVGGAALAIPALQRPESLDRVIPVASATAKDVSPVTEANLTAAVEQAIGRTVEDVEPTSKGGISAVVYYAISGTLDGTLFSGAVGKELGAESNSCRSEVQVDAGVDCVEEKQPDGAVLVLRKTQFKTQRDSIVTLVRADGSWVAMSSSNVAKNLNPKPAPPAVGDPVVVLQPAAELSVDDLRPAVLELASRWNP